MVSFWMNLGYAIVVIVLILILVLVALAALRAKRKRDAMRELNIDHMSLYFDEHFPKIIENFDLVTKSRFDEWSEAVNNRLSTVSSNLDSVQKFRKKFDPRVEKLEKRISKLENL